MMSLSQRSATTLFDLTADFTESHHCADVEVKGIALDSRQVEVGDLFVAVQGGQTHGAGYISQAIDRGAVAILVDSDAVDEYLSFSHIVPIVGIDKLIEHVSHIAGIFYAIPSRGMALTAITGTNGKTTCSRLYAALAESLEGNSAAFIGTLGYGMVNAIDRHLPAVPNTGLTTPDAVSMQKILDELRAEGATTVALEVSSHSLDQYRVAGLKIDTAVFTNLSRDHLDYHGDFQTYAAAKARLFLMAGLKTAVINIDDSAGCVILAGLNPNIQAITFSVENSSADIYCHTINHTAEGLRAVVCTTWGEGEICSPLLGRFNLANLLAVIGCGVAQGFSLADILRAVPKLPAVSGRMELIDAKALPLVVVDYEHTPDALKNALQTLRDHCHGRLWVVFGCGGDRDIGKRAEMGAIAAKWADQVVVTSDNPRYEDPQLIIQHIVEGVHADVIVEPDRRAAIREAIIQADTSDVVIIAGKGHEDYQILAAERLPFSDQNEARRALRAREVLQMKGGLK
jgi:UDP-N-acetylmuramoyl-L-alanyl-D-glutamate--2,6-diaminopimelate ligase